MKRLSTDAEYLNSGKIVLDADGIPFEPAAKTYVDQRAPLLSFTGTGSPEGKISAPVGSVYTDSAATNGAIRWIKSSGTSNTGWRVEYGDTGWRNISSLLSNGWGGNVYVRRINASVELRVEGLTRSDASYNIMTLPAGFLPGSVSGYGFRFVLHQADSTASQTRFRILSNVLTAVSSSVRGPYYGTAVWTISEVWPATLPGIPA